MSTTKLITMYGSPWSERVRWALKFKGLAYEKENYEPGVDEEKIKKLTGQAMVPVLVTDGKVIPDSSAILDWLEETRPEPVLLPKSAKDRATVTLWEELALNALGPHGRVMITGRLLRIDDPEAQKSGKYFAEKYGYSPFEEEQSRLTVTRILTSLKETLRGRKYLVGDTFTRADITTAAMLMLFKAAPQEFFVFTPELRFVYLDKLGDDPAFSEVFAWRDRMYKNHRGEVVQP
jgi:glutathione S-transferase